MRQFSGYFIIVFMFLAFVISIPAILKGYKETSAITLTPALSGQWTSLYENKFSDEVMVREPGLTLWGMVELLLFRDGRAGVIIGADGWLFTDEEFQYSKERGAIIKDHLDYIDEALKTLKHDGVDVVVALIPSKARVFKDKLGRYSYPSYNDALYDDTLSFIREHEVIAPNLYSALSKNPQSFIKTDTHWSPIGSAIAAQVLSEAVKNSGLQYESQRFTLEAAEAKNHKGDLLRYVPAGPVLEHFGLSSAALKQSIAVKAQDEELSEEALLFGEATIPFTLVGTSYSANTDWNFAEFLKVSLQADVLNAADEGRGPFATMKDYLEGADYKNSPPQIVIWEIPERYLALKDKN